MRLRKMVTRSVLAICAGMTLVASSFAPICYAAPAAGQETSGETAKAPDMEIHDLIDFEEFVENCKYDSWSVGKTVSLAQDLDLSSVDFSGIGYFNGTFEGNGHTISHVRLKGDGSDLGFFRYIGENGVVQNLNLEENVEVTGSQQNIGGIAGVNYGTISNCSFVGAVSGVESVGGIVGCNRQTGAVVSCSSNAVVLATNYTGGIAGTNEGKIADCKSTGSVNIEELDPTVDLAGMDVSALNLTRSVVNRNDMGGIAGHSGGLITGCVNEGTVGYKHTGYNAGGIVGSQNGILLDCTNRGEVYGRKDVGGIAGQAEPYVESEYLEDKVRQAQNDMNRLSHTLSNISSAMSQTSEEVRSYAENVSAEYTGAVDNISGNLQELAGAIDSSNTQAKEYASNIDAAWNNIQGIKDSGEGLTEENIQQIKDNLNTINTNLGNLQGAYDNTGTSAEALTRQLAEELGNSSERREETKSFAQTLDGGMQSIAQNMESAVNQINRMAASASDDLAALTSDEDIVTDISSVETSADMDGVISGCKNYGKIYGDLNVGGIAGTMNIEYGGDPEFDFDFSGSLNITLRSTVNDVMLHCINYGEVNAKRNCAGGIIGLQELGLLYDCEGYGAVSSESGSYLGGIAGNSVAAIEKSYSLCNIAGADYVGGICGSGYTVKESVSVCNIDSDGERLGSIAGFLDEKGVAEGNRFVSDKLHGVDDISYAGVADPVSYEDLMELADLPDGFREVTVTFEDEEGEVLSEKKVPYGGSIAEADFPEMEEKEGCYVHWSEEEELKDIRKNLTVTGEYVPWLTSIASGEKTESGKPVFLAVAEFYEDARLTLETVDGPGFPDENHAVAYAYAWELSDNQGKDYETIEAHLIKPETEDTPSVYVKENGEWHQVSSEEDGSYLTATIPYGADIAVVTQATGVDPAWIFGGAAVLCAAAALILWYVRKKRKKRKSAVSAEENDEKEGGAGA